MTHYLCRCSIRLSPAPCSCPRRPFADWLGGMNFVIAPAGDRRNPCCTPVESMYIHDRPPLDDTYAESALFGTRTRVRHVERDDLRRQVDGQTRDSKTISPRVLARLIKLLAKFLIVDLYPWQLTKVTSILHVGSRSTYDKDLRDAEPINSSGLIVVNRSA